MLPHKHYNAFDVEETLAEETLAGEADGKGKAKGTSGAEESTIRRWKRHFSWVLPELAAKLESLGAIFSHSAPSLPSLSSLPSLPSLPSLVEHYGALQRVYRAVSHLENVPEGVSRLSRAFHLSLAHPLCLG